MKKLFVYKIGEKLFKADATEIAQGIEILFEGNVGDEIPSDVKTLLDAQLINESKAEEVVLLYSEMVKDIYDQMEIVFGTRNDVSASAFASTFEAMLKRPANYVDAQLGFSNEAEVTAYANSKINASDAYGVFRMKRIGQYQAEKTAIEGA